MDQTCPKCGTTNPNTSRFCHACGMMLGATMVQGRTVVISPPVPSPPAPPPGGHSLVQSIGNTPVVGTPPVGSIPVRPALNTQRELTIFVEDVSGSMGCKYDSRLNKLQAAQRAAMSMVLEKARLDAQDEVGLVSFDLEAYEILHLCPIISHKRQILEAIQSLAVQGGTDINNGLKKARDTFEWHRQAVVRRIILLTDGQGGHPLQTAEDLKARGVVIDVVGVGDDPSEVDEKLLRAVASVVEGEVRYRFIKDSQTLVDHHTRLANKTAVGA